MRRTVAPRVAARILVLGALCLAGVARAETPIPGPPDRWVTDHAGFLSAGAVSDLDARLGDYDRRTGHQLLVYIDHTTGGVPIEDWAVKAFERWKVGRKGMDDGVVLFLFSDDHKLRIEVGYGLEGQVTDARASRIISEKIVPRIRTGDNDGAVRGGVDALLAAIGAPAGAADPVADPGQEPSPRVSVWHLVVGAIVILFLLGFAITHPALAWLMLLSIGSGRGGGGWGGGGGGGGGGGFSGGGGRSGGGGASGSW